MNPTDETLVHYGMPRRSGRYPWGSGDDPYQHGSQDFISRIEELKAKGWKETPDNIMKEFGLTTTQYRMEKAIAKDARRSLDVARAKSLTQDGLTPTQIGREMGVNESTVRSWLNQESEARMKKARETADHIKKQIDEKERIRIAFIGQWSSGKSSIISALTENNQIKINVWRVQFNAKRTDNKSAYAKEY